MSTLLSLGLSVKVNWHFVELRLQGSDAKRCHAGAQSLITSNIRRMKSFKTNCIVVILIKHVTSFLGIVCHMRRLERTKSKVIPAATYTRGPTSG